MVKKDEFELVDSCDDQDFETGHIDFEYTLKTVHLTESAEIGRASCRERV